MLPAGGKAERQGEEDGFVCGEVAEVIRIFRFSVVFEGL